MLNLLKTIILSAVTLACVASANDRADEYAPFTRLTDNYEVQNRKQNYDAFKFPTSINAKHTVEGEKILIEYGYKQSSVNASRLQFQRHFEKLARQTGSEIVYAGQSDDYNYAITLRMLRAGKTIWVLASTRDSKDIYHYKLDIVETTDAEGNTPAPMPVVAKPKAEPMHAPTSPEPAAASPAGITVEQVTQTGLDYVLSEYVLDILQYTSCGITLAKNSVSSNFDKARRDFVSVFPKSARQQIEMEFFSEDMKRLKEELAERGLMKMIDKAKRKNANMDVYCDNLVEKMVELNVSSRAKWNRLKARLASD